MCSSCSLHRSSSTVLIFSLKEREREREERERGTERGGCVYKRMNRVDIIVCVHCEYNLSQSYRAAQRDLEQWGKLRNVTSVTFSSWTAIHDSLTHFPLTSL